MKSRALYGLLDRLLGGDRGRSRSGEYLRAPRSGNSSGLPLGPGGGLLERLRYGGGDLLRAAACRARILVGGM